MTEEVIVGYFVRWMSKKEGLGHALNTEALYELRCEFLKELEGGGKSTAQEPDGHEKGAGKGRGRKCRSRMPWSIETEGRELRATFSKT